jgi:hypothetical protein
MKKRLYNNIYYSHVLQFHSLSIEFLCSYFFSPKKINTLEPRLINITYKFYYDYTSQSEHLKKFILLPNNILALLLIFNHSYLKIFSCFLSKSFFSHHITCVAVPQTTGFIIVADYYNITTITFCLYFNKTNEFGHINRNNQYNNKHSTIFINQKS